MSSNRDSRFLRMQRLAILGGILATLAACQNGQTAMGTDHLLAANDYRLRHPIVLTEAMETLDLPIGFSSRNLGPHLSGSVTAFGADARSRGNGRVEILIPSGAANESAVHSLTPQIRKALAQGGVARGSQMLRTYAVEDPNAEAPIRLAYARMQAVAGPCGEWPENIGGGVNQNIGYHNYGCASQSNLAAMVENPADLLAPRAMAPADQQRRAVVFEGYRNGSGTTSTYTEGVGANVSE